jgi:hypothetical protein
MLSSLLPLLLPLTPTLPLLVLPAPLLWPPLLSSPTAPLGPTPATLLPLLLLV